MRESMSSYPYERTRARESKVLFDSTISRNLSVCSSILDHLEHVIPIFYLSSGYGTCRYQTTRAFHRQPLRILDNSTTAQPIMYS